MEKMGRGEVILMRCRSGEVLGEVDPTVFQEALCSLVEAWISTSNPESQELAQHFRLSRKGPRESNFGTVAGLHETVTWKGRRRGGERGNKRRR